MLTIALSCDPHPDQPAGLFEMGTSSLKLHLVGRAVGGVRVVETCKFRWRVGHRHFGGEGSDGTASEVIERLHEAARVAPHIPLACIPAVATGAFREIRGFDLLARQIAAATGIRPALLGESAEAELVAEGFRARAWPAPAALFDLGGASTEWVRVEDDGELDRGSLPLGAIRQAYVDEARLIGDCDRMLAQLPIAAPIELAATGGTARALATVLRSDLVARDELDALIARVRRDGAPAELAEARRDVFLPGLVILSRILERCGAPQLRYCDSALRLGLVLRHFARAAGAPSPLERDGFADAVRHALRVIDRPDLLAASSLARTRLAEAASPPGAEPRARGVALGRALRDSARALLASPHDRDPWRSFERTYLVPAAAKQELIAQDLAMGYSTYRRYLAAAVRRLTEHLWQRELELLAERSAR